MTGRVSALSGLWLLVFVADAVVAGHGLSHEIGSIGTGLLFGALLVSELRAQSGSGRGKRAKTRRTASSAASPDPTATPSR